MISARKAKHLDATTMFTDSHANTPLGQSERAYYLSYFINTKVDDSEFTQVTAVTIMIYMARKVHTAYMFLECFEACQVSELTTDF